MNKKLLIFLLPTLLLASSEKNVFTYSDSKFLVKYDKKIKLLEKEELKSKLLDFNNINISSSIDYKTNPNILVQNNTVSIGFLNYNIGFNILDKKINSHKIYASKTLNDYFYNKFGEAEITKSLKELELSKEKEEKIESSLNLYKKYALKKLSVELYEKELLKNKKDLEILNKSYLLGAISKHEYNVSKSKIDLFESAYLLEKDELNAILIELKASNIDDYNTFSFDYNKNITLTREEIEKYVENTFVKLEKLNIAKSRLNKSKDLAINVLPKITPTLSYDILANSFGVGVNIYKDFEIISTNTNIEDDFDNALEKEKKLLINAEKLISQNLNSYNRLKYKYKANKISLSNLEEEYIINSKKYEVGSISYSKVLETKNNLLRVQLELEESKIDLLLFIAKIKRGEI